MAVLQGIAPSFHHARNGMIRRDMLACERVARELDEVIVFRSTGPWSRRWIERGHPTKNFHLKSKSSDWGPQAGFIPYDGLFSKKAVVNVANADGKRARTDPSDHSGPFARRVPLVLTRQELDLQLRQREGDEVAIRRHEELADGDILLWAGPHPDTKAAHRNFLFRAVRRGTDYAIHTYLKAGPPAEEALPDESLYTANKFKLVDAGLGARGVRLEPLYVMASNEVGAGDRPITGDYDLFAVIPRIGQYGSQAPTAIVKPGILLAGGAGLQKGLAFQAGVGMDNVLDPSLHTGKSGGGSTPKLAAADVRTEHADMGNVTPRVLRAINMLNAAMGATGQGSATRRVHHNAENLRPTKFGALSAKLMTDTTLGGGGYGDGFPLTVFAPPDPRLATYGTVSTLETYQDLAQFVEALWGAGFYVQRNVGWDIDSPLQKQVTPEFRAHLSATLLKKR